MAPPCPASEADLDALVRTLFGEARGEPEAGQLAVAWVIRNRVEWPGAPHWWGSTIGDVCRKAYQFSCWNENDPNCSLVQTLKPGTPEYDDLKRVASWVLEGNADDPTGHASHYERVGAGAAWAKGREFNTIIGNHAFYSIGPG